MKKKIAIILSVILFLAGIWAIYAKNHRNSHWSQAAEAAGGFPYQIGLTKISVLPCVPNPFPPICTGGPLCFTLDVGRCSMYQNVVGTPAGGSGMMALFTTASLTQAGVNPGGSLIAAGMGPTQMDNGILAGQAGCVGCTMAEAKKEDQGWLDKYIIAIFKQNEKDRPDSIDFEKMNAGQ